MLHALFGNKNIERILIFLFVNEKCYGTQLQRHFSSSLTPLQKALQKLENSQIVVSFLEGKTRFYQLNPAFPLLPELEQLLKKAYTLLSVHEKKHYYVSKEEELKSLGPSFSRAKVLHNFWEKLATVKQLSFNARTKSKNESGWNGKGRGDVIVSKVGPSELIFNEKGSWQGHQTELKFSNAFRWRLDKEKGVISLEHLRRGIDNPVFLFYLEPTCSHSLSSVDSHLCDGDAYFGKIFFDRYSLRLNWRVIGLKKNEELDYYYF